MRGRPRKASSTSDAQVKNTCSTAMLSADAAGRLATLRAKKYRMGRVHDSVAQEMRDRGFAVGTRKSVKHLAPVVPPDGASDKWILANVICSTSIGRPKQQSQYALRTPRTAFERDKKTLKHDALVVLRYYLQLWQSKRVSVIASHGLGVVANASIEAYTDLNELSACADTQISDRAKLGVTIELSNGKRAALFGRICTGA